VLDPDKGLRLKDSFSGIRRWITGGHSVGGTFACNMIARHPDVYQGIVLFAAYPAQSDDLSGWGAPVLSLTAEKDGLSTPAEIEAAKPLLPQAFHYTDPVQAYPVQKGYTLYHEIQGGCHSYFGHYGMQDGDGVPRISEDAQQNEMALYMDTFFTRVAP
jgi:pimeloyl-ACP methyl ester carboxylesterase